jgi:DNA-binding beta-propeller fold protein YncE
MALAFMGCQARAADKPAAARNGGAAQALRLVGSVPLPGVEGRFDHFASDAAGKRLYVAALGNNTMEVLDLGRDPGTHARTIKGLRKPTGIAFMPGSKRIAVASGDDGMCRIYDAASLELVGAVGDLDDADNVRYDAVSRRVYVGYGSGSLAVIDAAQAKKVADVKLDAHPESFRLEEQGSRIFVNLPDARNTVAVVDRNEGQVVAKWPLKEAGANFPMWLDEASHRLFVGCRRPAKLLVLDTDTGRTVAAVDCVGDTDDLFYDAGVRRIYVSGGDGAVDVISQQDPDHYRRVGRVDTAPGARTSLFVPDLRRLYVAVPHRNGQPAAIRVFEAPPPAP